MGSIITIEQSKNIMVKTNNIDGYTKLLQWEQNYNKCKKCGALTENVEYCRECLEVMIN